MPKEVKAGPPAANTQQQNQQQQQLDINDYNQNEIAKLLALQQHHNISRKKKNFSVGSRELQQDQQKLQQRNSSATPEHYSGEQAEKSAGGKKHNQAYAGNNSRKKCNQRQAEKMVGVQRQVETILGVQREVEESASPPAIDNRAAVAVVEASGGKGGGSTKHTTRKCKSNPFPKKLFDMLQKEDASIVSWLSNGDAFIVRNKDDFVANILPRYFRSNKMASSNDNCYSMALIGTRRGYIVMTCFIVTSQIFVNRLHGATRNQQMQNNQTVQ